jgi:hypothetical protein
LKPYDLENRLSIMFFFLDNKFVAVSDPGVELITNKTGLEQF